MGVQELIDGCPEHVGPTSKMRLWNYQRAAEKEAWLGFDNQSTAVHESSISVINQ